MTQIYPLCFKTHSKSANKQTFYTSCKV